VSLQQSALVAVIMGVLVGLGGILAVRFAWGAVGPRLNAFWSKFVSIPMQFLGLLSSAGATFERSEAKADWWPNAIAGAVAFVTWAILQNLIEYRLKEADRSDAETLKKAEGRIEAFVSLMGTTQVLIDRKVNHMRSALSAQKGKSTTVKTMRDCLRPGIELDDLLTAICKYFIGLVPSQRQTAPNFRAVLFVSNGGILTPEWGSSYIDNSWEKPPSFLANRDAFRLTEPVGASLVVASVLNKAAMLHADTIDAAARGEFTFLHEGQASYLRSIFACPLGKVSRPGPKLEESVLVIDTNVPEFFQEEDRAFLEFCLREFASRIKLELVLEAIFAQ
jgi:hypothetical protein